jgi:hypothetical protein
MGGFEAGEWLTEVAEPVVMAGDGDAKIGDLGEIPKAIRRGGCSWWNIISRSGQSIGRKPELRHSSEFHSQFIIPVR